MWCRRESRVTEHVISRTATVRRMGHEAAVKEVGDRNEEEEEEEGCFVCREVVVVVLFGSFSDVFCAGDFLPIFLGVKGNRSLAISKRRFFFFFLPEDADIAL